MATPSEKPSFSPVRKWAIGFNVVLTTLLVLAVLIMVNYLSGRYFDRVHLGTKASFELSPRTVSLVRSITNRVHVTLYFDKDVDLYSDVSFLLREYHAKNSRIDVSTVDYYRDPGEALAVKTKFNLGSATNENFVIFESGDRSKVIAGNELVPSTIEPVSAREYRRKPISFLGESRFTEALLAVTTSEPKKAYFLEGHGEQLISDGGDLGLSTFAGILKQNYIVSQPLTLLGTNTVPQDCDVLIIPGPRTRLTDFELGKLGNYLTNHGRLFVLFNAQTRDHETGIEALLREFGVNVLTNLVIDTAQLDRNSIQKDGIAAIGVSAFTLHPAVNPVIGTGLYMFLPRPVLMSGATNLAAELRNEPIANTSSNAYLVTEQEQPVPRMYPVVVASEQTGEAAAANRPGPARMLVSGDSFLFSNQLIELLGNRDFASSSANWLVERPAMLEGVGPRPVTEYRLVVSQSQMQKLELLLLGAVPGGILVFGGMIWLSRRK